MIILETKVKEKSKSKVWKKVLTVILAIILLFVIGDVISMNWHSNPDNIKTYETANPYILGMGNTQISAHRSGGGIMPEETMKAFKNCAEDGTFTIDVFEFDLHITKDDVFVVWSCKALQNNKALLSTTVYDGMYYEITFNGDKKEMYFDAYKKWENRCIKID